MTREQALLVFGLTDTADERQVKKVYRVLSKKYHPDIAGADSNDMFLKVKKAYDVLTGSVAPTVSGGYTHDNIFNVRKV